MKYKFWEVQTQIGNDWENIWTVTNPDGDHERPDIFTTMEDAEDQLRLHLKSMDIEGMDYDPADYRVQYVEIDPAAQANVRDGRVVSITPGMGIVGIKVGRLPEWLDLGCEVTVTASARTPADDSQKGGEA